MSMRVTVIGASPATLVALRRAALLSVAGVAIVEGKGIPAAGTGADWLLVADPVTRVSAVQAGFQPYRVGLLAEPLDEGATVAAFRRMAAVGSSRTAASALGVRVGGALLRWYASRGGRVAGEGVRAATPDREIVPGLSEKDAEKQRRNEERKRRDENRAAKAVKRAGERAAKLKTRAAAPEAQAKASAVQEANPPAVDAREPGRPADSTRTETAVAIAERSLEKETARKRRAESRAAKDVQRAEERKAQREAQRVALEQASAAAALAEKPPAVDAGELPSAADTTQTETAVEAAERLLEKEAARRQRATQRAAKEARRAAERAAKEETRTALVMAKRRAADAQRPSTGAGSLPPPPAAKRTRPREEPVQPKGSPAVRFAKLARRWDAPA